MNANSNAQIDLKELLITHLGLTPGECAGKTVLVTGAGRGIGLQAARSFALLGGQVVIAEISTETGVNAEALIRAEGGEASFVQTDVSQNEAVLALARAVSGRYGPVDILINNAIRCPVAPVAEMDLGVWDEVIGVNLRGAFLTCKTFLPGMLEQGRGVIVNMVSTDAMPGLSAYIASKQGIQGFSLSLAQEIAGCGVSVIPFGPGMVDTPAIREAAVKLSPLLGMTAEAFLGFSLHPAYPGLMPPEHAGAATAYLALRLAGEYHGQAVNGYEVLERAGFLQPAAVPDIATSAETKEEHTAENTEALREQLGRLREILMETGQEFEKLPIFVRPMARSGFKGKAGMSPDEWQRTITAVEQRLGQLAPGECQDLLVRLEKLAGYYQGVPGETARFTRDPALLQQVAETCRERLDCIQRVKVGLGVVSITRSE